MPTRGVPMLGAVAALALALAAPFGAGAGCRNRSDDSGAGAPAPSGEEAAPEVETLRPPDPAIIRELVVHDLTPSAARIADLSGELDEIVRESLAKTKRVQLAPAPEHEGGREGGYDLGVGVVYVLLVDEQPATTAVAGSLTVLVTADMGRRTTGHLPETYEANATVQRPYDPATDGPLGPILRKQVERAVDDTRGRLVASLRLAGGSDAAVLAMLADPDPLVRAAAAREAGERRLRDAVPALIEALGSDRAELRQAALGAAGQLGDPRAVPAVARLTSGMDGSEIRIAVFVLGDIGGPEARRYLETIVFSHPMPAIRQAAETALGGLGDDERGTPP